jgi:hypothetical protein
MKKIQTQRAMLARQSQFVKVLLLGVDAMNHPTKNDIRDLEANKKEDTLNEESSNGSILS